MKENKIQESSTEQPKKPKVFDESAYPSVPLIFPISLKSLDWQLQRIEAKDSSLRQTLSWVVTATMGFFALAFGNLKADPNNCWELFAFGSIACISAIAFCVTGLTMGSIQFPNLQHIQNTEACRSNWDFQRWFTSQGEQHMLSPNRLYIERKHRALVSALILFSLEAVAYCLWLILQLTEYGAL